MGSQERDEGQRGSDVACSFLQGELLRIIEIVR